MINGPSPQLDSYLEGKVKYVLLIQSGGFYCVVARKAE